MNIRWLLVLPLVGCGDTTSAVGELGRVRYTLFTTYIVDERPLDQVKVVTGHPQLYFCDLTDKGERRAGDDAWLGTHTLTPATNTTVVVDEGDEDAPDELPDFVSTVLDAGDYRIETSIGDRQLDYLDVVYATPTQVEVLTWLRAPDAADFTLAEGAGPYAVVEGTQAAFLPIPIADGGERLVGDIETTLTSSPSDVVVQGENIYGIYEQEVVSSPNPVSIYFIEPGDVSVTIEDAANGVSATLAFTVSEG